MLPQDTVGPVDLHGAGYVQPMGPLNVDTGDIKSKERVMRGI